MLKADVTKTNHHGSYSSNAAVWVEAVDPKVLITHSDDTGDSAQCYMYSQQGRAWYGGGRDGGVLVVMDNKDIVSVTTGYDNDMRSNLVACGTNGHDYTGQPWLFDENGHWRQCKQHWLCGAVEAAEPHTGGTATTEEKAVCETCGSPYGELLPEPGDINDQTTTEDNSYGGQLAENVDTMTDKLFTEDEKEQIRLGADAKYYLCVDEIAQLSAEEAELVGALLGDSLEIAFCADIDLFKQIGTENPIQMTQTAAPIRLSLQLPGQYINNDPRVERTFGVIRVHEGVAEKLVSELGTDQKLVFETDGFSTYVVYYKDVRAIAGEITDLTPAEENAFGGKLETSLDKMTDLLFTDEEKLQIDLGEDAMFYLFVRELSQLSAQEEALVKAQLGTDLKLAFSTDITLFKQIGAGAHIPVSEIGEPIRLSLELADRFINDDSQVSRAFGVIRVHDGFAEIIASEMDGERKITFATDHFSTYVVYYKDTPITSGGTGGSGNTGDTSDENTGGNQGGSGGTAAEPGLGTDTGDAGHMVLWIGAMAACMMIAGVTMKRKYRMW